MRRLLGVLFVFAFVAASARGGFAASPLEGTKWRVEITPDGTTTPHFVDRVLFEEGKITSVLFQRKGFAPVPYTAGGKSGSPVTWDAKQKSDAEGELSWHGEVEGETLKGTLVWKQADGKNVTYDLAGSPVVEEPAPDGQSATTSGGKSSEKPATEKKKGWGCSLIVP